MVIRHFFRSGEKMRKHFNEHGKETGCDTPEEYLIRANEVIENPEARVKRESDEGDNDMIYYLSDTGEIVFVSDDGYIRTYYIADDDYFKRQ